MASSETLDSAQWFDDLLAVFEDARRSSDGIDFDDYLPAAGHPLFAQALCEMVRVDLEYGWSCGRPRPLADYLERYPALARSPAQLEAVAYEEYRLRRQAGDAARPDEYGAKLGLDTSDWPVSASSLARAVTRPATSSAGPDASAGMPHASGSAVDEQRSAGPDEPTLTAPGSSDRLPSVGESFAEFELIAELGQGSIGRVYYARQRDLAGRRVALKISPQRFEESLKLAQLQHSHIVPVYSVHRCGSLQAVCMPFFGSTTLVDVMRAVRALPTLPRTGQIFVDVICERRCELVARAEVLDPGGAQGTNELGNDDRLLVAASEDSWSPLARGQALAHLAAMDYVDAVLCLGACLTEALAHAHERGILHRDLKPANVLLADDGRPMLLDFNLATDLKREPEPSLFGGTLPYMAPEQLAGLEGGVPTDDARSDLYALGIILREMLCGEPAFAAHEGRLSQVLARMIRDRAQLPPLPRSIATPAVRAIIARCLQPDPANRYRSAHDLHEDLQRQLDHRPLRFAADRSPLERLRKWARRHPKATSAGSVALLAGVLLVTLTLLLVLHGRRLAQLEALTACDLFAADLQAAQVAFLEPTTGDTGPWTTVDAACRRALARVGAPSRGDWQHNLATAGLPPEKITRLSADVGELLFLMAAAARMEAAAATTADAAKAALARSLDLNHQAERCFSPGAVPGALWHQRGSLDEQLGLGDAEAWFAKSAAVAPAGARDLCMAGCMYLTQQRYREALPYWQRGTAADPRNLWAWYGLAVCNQRLGRHAQAASAFNVAVALDAQHTPIYFGRGVAYLEQGELDLALADFDWVLERQSDHLEALVNRALVHLSQHDAAAAEADFTRAIAAGKPSARLYLLRARARSEAGDEVGAAADRKRGLELPPADEQDWLACGVARVESDPAAALDAFERALTCNPHSLAALQNKAHVLSERLARPREAVEALGLAIGLFPESSQCLADRGVLLARLGEDDAARGDASRALELEPTPAVVYRAACVYALTSERNAADQPRSLDLLAAALRQNFGGDLLVTDHDLDALRSQARFAEFEQAVRALAADQ